MFVPKKCHYVFQFERVVGLLQTTIVVRDLLCFRAISLLLLRLARPQMIRAYRSFLSAAGCLASDRFRHTFFQIQHQQ